MERLWSQAGATGGKWGALENRSNGPIPQPVATHGNGSPAHGNEGGRGASPLRATRSAGHVPGVGVALSMKTSFRGPLVAQTSIGRLAQPCGEDVAAQRKAPANELVQRRLSRSVVAAESACHAGGRGF